MLLVAVLLQIFLQQAKANGADNISKVYIVFSNHFDCGYTKDVNGSTSGAVVNQYFHEHFPAAIAVANEARSKKGKPYKWMTQAWLVDVYRNCNMTNINTHGPDHPSDLICPNSTAVLAFEAAVRRGDINWHAFPFNSEPELFTPELFDAALNMTFAQDAYFGHSPRQTLSQRDVPGLTRNAIPLLTRRGVRAVSVGENSQVAPSAVPPIFLWHDNRTNTEVIAMYHALGYGGAWPATYTKNIADNTYIDGDGTPVLQGAIANPNEDGPSIHVASGIVYGNTSRSEACVQVPSAGVALCYAWKVDNSGPHSNVGSELVFDVVRGLFPSASEIVASDGFDDFVTDVWPHRNELPIVTAEIGDTWMFGADADPLKVALFRAASRCHSQCVQNNDCVSKANNNIKAFRTFERLLMVAGEHTWGWNGGHIKSKSWENEELQHSLKTDPQFQTAVIGWKEQRAILRNAVASLPAESILRNEIVAAWDDVEGSATREYFNVNGMSSRLPLNATSTNSIRLTACEYDMSIGIDGSIVSLTAGSVVVADSTHPLAKLWYQGMDAKFFKTYVKQYIAGVSDIWPELTAEGLYKPNLKSPALSSNGTVTKIMSNGKNRVVVTLSFLQASHEERGAPAEAQIEHVCQSSGMTSTVRWFNKTATHIPETIWFSSVPMESTDKSATVTLDKMGQPMDAMDVDLNCDGMEHLTCGVHLHGVGDQGVLTTSTALNAVTSATRIISLDSALVSVGIASPVPTPLVKPDIKGGIHFALVGNIWNVGSFCSFCSFCCSLLCLSSNFLSTFRAVSTLSFSRNFFLSDELSILVSV